MGLALLGIMVVVGITLVVVLVHVTAPPDRIGLADAEAAREVFMLDFPDAVASEAVITADARSAVLRLRDGGAGIVHGMGARYLTRELTSGIGQVRRDGSAVEIRLADIGWGGALLRFADETEAVRAAAILGAEG